VCNFALKPRPYLQQCRSNIIERYELNDSFDNVECCFDKVERCSDNVAGVDGALRTVDTGISLCYFLDNFAV